MVWFTFKYLRLSPTGKYVWYDLPLDLWLKDYPYRRICMVWYTSGYLWLKDYPLPENMYGMIYLWISVTKRLPPTGEFLSKLITPGPFHLNILMDIKWINYRDWGILGRNHHHWITIRDHLKFDSNGRLVLDTYILIGDPHILIGDPHILIGNPHFSHCRPSYSHWRPQIFIKDPQIFVRNPQIFVEDENVGVSNERWSPIVLQRWWFLPRLGLG